MNRMSTATGVERIALLRGKFLLPPDVLLFPVTDMAPRLRETLDCNADDYAVTRPHMRTFSRIVDPDTAALLEEFRNATSLVEAIIRHSSSRNLDPQILLEKAFPVLQAFSAAAFLVPADSSLAEGVVASFAPGQVVAGYEVIRLVQVLHDSEVYQAKGADGHSIALKLTKPGPDEELLFAFGREAVALEELHGICSPELIEYGVFRERAFIATTWLPGITIGRRAQELRSGAEAGWREKLHRLCCRLIDAYSVMHDRGVLHGDVHASNVLVDSDDAVSILDYGLALVNDRPELHHNRRAGLAWFMEPALARAILDEQPLPASSPLGEQYSVAALIYYLLCGEYCVSATPEREVLYRRVLDSAPLPFTRHGIASWPDVEKVLSRALAKPPADRYESMRHFSKAFASAGPGPKNGDAATQHLVSSPTWVNGLYERILEPCAYESFFPKAPTASVYFGALGVAWLLYRTASIREDGRYSAAADLWVRQAMDRQGDVNSFDMPPGTAQERIDARSSVYLGRNGLHVLGALSGLSRGDMHSCSYHTSQAVRALDVREGPSELLLGRSGLLVGGSLLYEALAGTGVADAEPLGRNLGEASQAVWDAVESQSNVQGDGGLAHLGVAHGWAGILYSQLLVDRVLNSAPKERVLDALTDLACKAEPHGRGAAWLGTLQHPGQTTETPSYAPGWCSGSAGHIALWALAAEVTQEERFAHLAEKAAWHTWEHADRSPNLCCGLIGRAFGLLRQYRYSGDITWLSRAKRLADIAFRYFTEKDRADELTFSLYRGTLGAVLLATELECPERAVMPLFELEGWPAIQAAESH